MKSEKLSIRYSLPIDWHLFLSPIFNLASQRPWIWGNSSILISIISVLRVNLGKFPIFFSKTHRKMCIKSLRHSVQKVWWIIDTLLVILKRYRTPTGQSCNFTQWVSVTLFNILPTDIPAFFWHIHQHVSGSHRTYPTWKKLSGNWKVCWVVSSSLKVS